MVLTRVTLGCGLVAAPESSHHVSVAGEPEAGHGRAHCRTCFEDASPVAFTRQVAPCDVLILHHIARGRPVLGICRSQCFATDKPRFRLLTNSVCTLRRSSLPDAVCGVACAGVD
jgi:hypothetical protein